MSNLQENLELKTTAVALAIAVSDTLERILPKTDKARKISNLLSNLTLVAELHKINEINKSTGFNDSIDKRLVSLKKIEPPITEEHLNELGEVTSEIAEFIYCHLPNTGDIWVEYVNRERIDIMKYGEQLGDSDLPENFKNTVDTIDNLHKKLPKLYAKELSS